MEEVIEPVEPSIWHLFMDGSTRDIASGVGVVFVSLEKHKRNSTVRFGFKATNNVTEYKALLAGLRFAKEMQVRKLLINSDFQLVVSQVNGNFSKVVIDLLPSFENVELIQIPRVENAYADALLKLTSSKDFALLTIIPIEHLLRLSPDVMWVERTPT